METVIKNSNRMFYEWGMNCSTLGFGVDKARRCFDSFNLDYSVEDYDEFWVGYEDGPRKDKTLVLIDIPSKIGV